MCVWCVCMDPITDKHLLKIGTMLIPDWHLAGSWTLHLTIPCQRPAIVETYDTTLAIVVAHYTTPTIEVAFNTALASSNIPPPIKHHLTPNVAHISSWTVHISYESVPRSNWNIRLNVPKWCTPRTVCNAEYQHGSWNLHLVYSPVTVYFKVVGNSFVHLNVP